MPLRWQGNGATLRCRVRHRAVISTNSEEFSSIRLLARGACGAGPRSTAPYQIHSVASFYPHFQLAPPPKADVRVCADMSCHLNGACELRAELEQRFAKTGPEDVTIRDVSCLGRCDQAPAISINDDIFADVTAASAEAIKRAARFAERKFRNRARSMREWLRVRPLWRAEKYGVLRRLWKIEDWDGVLAELKASGCAGWAARDFRRAGSGIWCGSTREREIHRMQCG